MSTVYPCLIGDSKDIWIDPAYVYSDGTAYGHVLGDDPSLCNIMEIMVPGNERPATELLNKLEGVTEIRNGGNCLDGSPPTGLGGNINYYQSGYNSNASLENDEEYTLYGEFTSFIRRIWSTLSAIFENNINGRDEDTVLYSLNPKDKPLIHNGEFIQYYQNDYPNVPYGVGDGDGNLVENGCGPTAFAMVATNLTKKMITPADVVAWCGDRYYIKNVGTAFAFFEAAKEHYQLDCTYAHVGPDQIDRVVSDLRSGAIVISSQGEGLFTTGGHYIVLYGIIGKDGISVKDPWKRNAEERGYNTRIFTKEEINEAATNYFIFKPN